MYLYEHNEALREILGRLSHSQLVALIEEACMVRKLDPRLKLAHAA